ncbi:MAG: amino acid ABC transporter substrate-binding protein [Hyphomicrobiaceae bacterium]|jgi:general L-amino acid transport system substrate-binding protein
MTAKLKLACLAGALVAAASTTAFAGARVDAIKARGELICGVNTALGGFSIADSTGKWVGLDVDVCRAVAATLLGDGNKVKFVPLNAQQRFTALQSGEVDILSRNTTWTLTRDTQLGLNFAATTYYDGQGFMVPKALNVTSAKQLAGASVCVQPGTTTELNLADYFRANNMQYKPVVIENIAEVNAAFFAGRCDALTTDASGLASVRKNDAKNPDDYVILPDIISKEPLGPAVAQGDDQWTDIVKWTVFALLEAEEYGITQANVEEMAKTSTNPNIKRILGATPGMGKALGVDEDWVVKAVKSVGNYGEVWTRNITPLGLPRGVNNLWNKGGLMYAPPIR